MNTYAKAGEQLSPKATSYMRAHYPHMRYMLATIGTVEGRTIRSKGDSQQGLWACADCGHVFSNNLEAQGHRASHRLCWWTGTQFEDNWESEIHSVAAAIQNMLLMAYNLGLGSLWIADIFYAPDAIVNSLGKKWKLTAAVTLGWPHENERTKPPPRKMGVDEDPSFWHRDSL